MEQGVATFSCDQCGKEYKWRPEFAGRKVKCKCRFVMTAPAKAGGGAPVARSAAVAGKVAAPAKKKVAVPSDDDGPNLDALYDLAADGQAAAAAAPAMIRCPSCKNEMEPGLAMCPSCGFNLKTGSKAKKAAAGGAAAAAGGAPRPGAKGTAAPAGGAYAAFGAPRKRGEDLKVERNDTVVDWVLPIALLAGGMVLGTLKFTTFSAQTVPTLQGMMYAGLTLVLGFVLIAVAAIFMIQWGEIAFGDPAQAAIKIAAAVTAPVFIANIISFLLHDAPPYGWGLVGFFLAFGMFFVFYHYMFEWDLSEKWVVVGVTTTVTMLAVPFLFALIVNGGHLGTGNAQENDDASIALMDELGRPKDAQAWMTESPGRIFGDFSRTDSEEFLNGIYALGPKKVEVVPVGPQGGELYIKLPPDDKRRKAIVDYVSKWMESHKKGALPDKGGKWLLVRFMFVDHPQPV